LGFVEPYPSLQPVAGQETPKLSLVRLDKPERFAIKILRVQIGDAVKPALREARKSDRRPGGRFTVIGPVQQVRGGSYGATNQYKISSCCQEWLQPHIWNSWNTIVA
jgi:hypothetical protein